MELTKYGRLFLTNNMKKTLILLIILAIATIVRFYSLGTFPALNADEAAIGYNAYSLIQTGLDEHGNPWPIHFQSFNDYKPGLYFYLVLPFVKLIGLGAWAVRIPSAALGVMTVLIIYLLAYEIKKDTKFTLFSALLLAINPWHIHFSRGGWEVNVATFFLASGVLFLYKARQKKQYYFVSAIVFVLSLYTYHASRIVVPLLLVSFVLLSFKQIIASWKVIATACVIALLLLLPLVKDMTTGALISRAAGVGLFADPGPASRVDEQRGEHGNYAGLLAKALHNKVVNYSLDFAQNWGKHYWGEFLFLSGDGVQRDKVPETGQFHLVELIFITVGMLYIIRRPQNWSLILAWIIFAPFAASLTFQSPHALRAHNMVIPLTLTSAYGLSVILELFGKATKSKQLSGAFSAILLLVLAWSTARYIHMYWIHMSKEYPFSSQYGVEQLVSYLKENQDRYNNVVVTDRYDQPYILFLFYMHYTARAFSEESLANSPG